MLSFLEPESVVLIGVPRQSGAGSYNNLEVMLRYGYKGRIYVVHPQAVEICGFKTYSSIKDIPEVPDLAVISVGRDRVLPVFQECVQKGLQSVIIISQGFADADEEGKRLQKELSRIARDNKVRILGPNTMGILNPFFGFSTAFVDIPRDSSPLPLTMVVQSGIFLGGFEFFTHRMGKAIDLGNTCDLDFVDMLNFLEADTQTEIIVLHMESLSRGREFLQIASRITQKKPILVLKAGRSSEGAKAALSHSGSMVGEDSVFQQAFDKAGVVRVNSMIELLAASKAFLNYKPMQGSRISVITAAGGAGIMSADACEDYGLELAPFPERIDTELKNSRIPWYKLQNPVDIWPIGMVSGSFPEVFKNAARLLIQEDKVDALLGIIPVFGSSMHSDLDMVSCIRDIEVYNHEQKPIALWCYGNDTRGQKAELERIPDTCVFKSIDEAIMGLSATWRYTQHVHKKAKEKALETIQDSSPRTRPITPSSNEVLLGEKGYALLEHYNIPIVPGKIVDNISSAISEADEIGYPVALKILSSEWLHKSDMGGVKLNIYDKTELLGAFSELYDLFYKQTPQGVLQGILIQKYIKGLELLFGIKRDPQFGSIVLAGFGGIYTEVFRDISKRIVPVSESEAENMLGNLKSFPLLAGIRGQAGADISRLKEIILSLSQMAKEYPEIEELDLNPVVVTKDGCWCVDARIIFR